MGPKPQRLTLRYSSAAIRKLDGIWDWTVEHFGPDQADRYVAFLRSETAKLERNREHARSVPTMPDLLYVTIRARPKRHGHLAVFRIREGVLEIVNYYHTAQDWQSHVLSDGDFSPG